MYMYYVAIQHIQPTAEGKKGLHTFWKGISPKLDVTALLEFELAFFEAEI